MKKLLPYAIFLTFLISFLFVADANAEGASPIQQITKDTAVYVEPSVDSAVIGQIAKGSYVKVVSISGEWATIKGQQLEGYVEKTALASLTSEKYIVANKGGTSLFTYPSPSSQKNRAAL